jgi:hypothetical protein
MANVYVVTGITHLGDNATVVGTVNGLPVVVQCNFSAITQQPSVAAFEAFIAPLMLQQAQPTQPTSFPGFNGTWTA